MVLLDANVPVFSFIYGTPPAEILADCRTKGIFAIGMATTPDEALALLEAGVNAIVASGFEAGGHRGSFLPPAEDSLMRTLSLVPQFVDAVDAPVITAGGMADARGVIAALALGAAGVQMGTLFLACAQSGASRLHRQALQGKNARHMALTKASTGRLARGINNRLVEELTDAVTEILSYPLQQSLVGNLSAAAQAANRAYLMSQWAGQSAYLSACMYATDFLHALVEEVSKIADAVTAWSAIRRENTSHSE